MKSIVFNGLYNRKNRQTAKAPHASPITKPSIKVFFFIITSIFKQRIHELALVEQLQVLHALAQSDVLHGHLQLV